MHDFSRAICLGCRRFRRRVALFLVAAGVGLLGFFAMPLSTIAQTTQESAAPYKLGVRDRVTIRIGQWKRAEGVYEAWKNIEGEYAIGPAGKIFLPLIGAVQAAGSNEESLAKAIASRIDTQLGLSDSVTVSVEIAQFRPVYVLGKVNLPGAYPYVPGLTVIQAVGLAGGLIQGRGIFLRAERDALSARGEFEVQQLALWRAFARQARLEAELNDRKTLEIPQTLSNVALAEGMIEVEREIMLAFDKAMTSSLAQIKSLEVLLRKQIKKLEKRTELRARQIELARDELEKVGSLMKKGLTVTSRYNSIARMVAELESNAVELETAVLQAEQRLNEAGRDRLDLINDRRRQLVIDLRQTRAEIERIEARITTASALFGEAARFGTGIVRLKDMSDDPIFKVTGKGESVPRKVDRGAPLRPGDVLEVEALRLKYDPTNPGSDRGLESAPVTTPPIGGDPGSPSREGS